MADNRQKNRGNMSTARAITYALGFFAIGMLMWYILPGMLTRDHNTHDTALSGNPAQQEVHARYNPSVDRVVNVKGGFELVPTGTPVSFEKDKLAAIMTSEEGYILYSQPTGEGQGANKGGGGGIGEDQKRSGVPGLPQAPGPVYVELEDGRFQRLIQQ